MNKMYLRGFIILLYLAFQLQEAQAYVTSTTQNGETNLTSNNKSGHSSPPGYGLMTESSAVTLPPLSDTTSPSETVSIKSSKSSSESPVSTTSDSDIFQGFNSFFDNTHGIFIILFSIIFLAFFVIKLVKYLSALVKKFHMAKKDKKVNQYQKWLAVYSPQQDGNVVYASEDGLKTL